MDNTKIYVVRMRLANGYFAKMTGCLFVDALGNVVIKTPAGQEVGRTTVGEFELTDIHGVPVECSTEWMKNGRALVPIE